MIILKNISSSFPGHVLFKEVSFTIHPHDRLGIVGHNGSGKTTFLRMLMGEIDADTGAIDRSNERIGYLPQDLIFTDDETIASYMYDVPHTLKEKVLERVGLQGVDMHTLIASLSGGQKRKLGMAKVLGMGPTMLLLDEPTNHLDRETILWLEEFINTFKGGVVIVSHDRSLLDAVTTTILEILPSEETIRTYPGNYTAYTLEKDRRDRAQNDAHQRQQKERRRLELWLARKKEEARIYADPKKGRMIRAKERYLEREIIAKTIKKADTHKKIAGVELEGNSFSGKLICRCSDVTKQYNENEALKDISFEIRGKERILIAGENGSGKTTLLRILMGRERPSAGVVRIGENLSLGYFAQEHEDLDVRNEVIEEFLLTPDLISTKNARAVLGGFLFSGNDIYKTVSQLSLGERVRLIFAKLTNQRHECLILDEPTNHLDIASREVIETALMEYEGALIVVSHDRYFVDKIGFTRVITLKDGKIVDDTAGMIL